MPLIPVLTPAQSSDWDRTSEAAGMPIASLMENAGRAAATVVAERLGAACRQGVLVVAGCGNNGADGWVMARALHAAGIPCWVAPLPRSGSPLNIAAAARARADGVREVSHEGPWPAPGLLVDALLGTGARGAPRPEIRSLLSRMTDLDRPIVALDGPTGLDLGDGVSHDACPAILTITFGGYRRGQLLSRDECGDLVVVDIGLAPPDVAWPSLAQVDGFLPLLPPFASNLHKGKRGRIVIVGGNAGMTGAARLSARAAFAAGAGLVHVMAPEASVAALAAAEPDVQTLVQSFESPLSSEALTLLSRADAVVVGPGLGRHAGRADLVLAVIGASRRVVIDADALVALPGRLPDLVAAGSDRQLVLTPHLGEFRAIFPGEASMAAVDPWGAVQTAASAVGAVVLLKGVPSVVAQPARSPVTIAAGNPGLATGGSGDCLAGMAAALLAQGLGPRDAAVVAAVALGEAADLAARRTGVRGLRPMDVVSALPDLWREWERRRIVRPLPRPPILHELPLPRRS